MDKQAAKAIFINRLATFSRAAAELAAAWEDYEHLSGNVVGVRLYPFARSFDSVALEIKEWADDTANSITNSLPFVNDELHRDFKSGKYFTDLSTAYGATLIHDIIGGTLTLGILYNNGSAWEKVATYSGYTQQEDVTADVELLKRHGLHIENKF